MADRFARFVGQQVLLRHIGDVIALVVLGQQVIEGLLLRWTRLFGDGVIPFLGIGKARIDIEDHTPERVLPMPDHLSDVIFRPRGKHVIASLEFVY